MADIRKPLNIVDNSTRTSPITIDAAFPLIFKKQIVGYAGGGANDIVKALQDGELAERKTPSHNELFLKLNGQVYYLGQSMAESEFESMIDKNSRVTYLNAATPANGARLDGLYKAGDIIINDYSAPRTITFASSLRAEYVGWEQVTLDANKSYVLDNTHTWRPVAGSGGAGGGTGEAAAAITWSYKNASFTAEKNNGYIIDTAAAALNVTLPATAANGDVIYLYPAASSYATNPVTVLRNGHNIATIADDMLINTNGLSLAMTYIDATYGWLVTEPHELLALPTYSVGGQSVFGVLSGNDHSHAFALTDEEAKNLIDGTVPNVVKTTTFVSGHTHDVTIVYNSTDKLFVVTTISGNHIPPHAASILGGSGGGKKKWNYVSADTAAIINNGYFVNTTSNGVFITMPSNPNNGDTVTISDVAGTSATNNINVLRAGNKIMNLAEDYVINTNGQTVEFTYSADRSDWRITSFVF